MPSLTPALILGLRRLGIIVPVRMVLAAQQVGLSIPLAASILTQESGGGANVFGHDPTIFIGAGEVTKAKYLAYRAQRGPTGAGGMQGVGPVQLTWWAFQDRADALGGCWAPLANMRAGFEVLAANIRRDGLGAGVAAYNGSGPAAIRYAAEVLARADRYAVALKLPPPH